VKDKKAEKHTQVQHALPESSAPAQRRRPSSTAALSPNNPNANAAEAKETVDGSRRGFGIGSSYRPGFPFLKLQDPFPWITV